MLVFQCVFFFVFRFMCVVFYKLTDGILSTFCVLCLFSSSHFSIKCNQSPVITELHINPGQRSKDVSLASIRH